MTIEEINTSKESSLNVHRKVTETSEKSSEKTLQELHRNFIETLQKKDRDIVELVIANSKITQNEMAAALNITPRAIANRMKSMQERGIILRVGPDKGGHWEIVKGKEE